MEAGIRTSTKQLVDKGVITEAELNERLGRISFTTDIDSDLVKNADFVIEAVFEDMKIKRETLCQAGRALRGGHHLLHQLLRHEAPARSPPS